MTVERHTRARDLDPGDASPEASDSQRGTLANPEPTSGVVERATGLACDPRLAPGEHLASDQRDTPQFDLWAGRTPTVPLLSVDEAERHAAQIRPLWQDPERLEQLRVRRVATRPPVDAAGRLVSALPAGEADYHAARMRPVWEPPLTAPSATPPDEGEARALLAAALRETEFALDEMLRDPADREMLEAEAEARFRKTLASRRRRLRLALVAVAAVAGIALVGTLLATRGPAPEAHPITLRSGLTALESTNAGPASELPAATLGPIAKPGAEPPLAPPAAKAASDGLPKDADAPTSLEPTVRVRIHADPPNARIRIDGRRVSNPFDERLPAGKRRRLLIEARGYEGRDYMLASEADERIRVALEKLPAP